METPLITWAAIVGIVVLLVVIRIARTVSMRHGVRRRHSIVRLGNDREEFFVPGDPDPRKLDNYGFDDFDDVDTF